MASVVKKAIIVSLILIGLIAITAFIVVTQFVYNGSEKNNSSSPITSTLSSLDQSTMETTSDFDAEIPLGYQDRTAKELATWREWKQKYGKTYDNNRNETVKRQGVFLNNLRWINAFNANSKTLYKLTANHFADLTQAEINNLYIGPSIRWADTLQPIGDPTQYQIVDIAGDNSGAKSAVDWRNAAGPVLDQNTCRAGSVYASVANIESYYNLINASQQVRLSEKQVLDCLLLESEQQQSPNACSGGVSSVIVYQTLQRVSSGLSTEQNYNAYLSTLNQSVVHLPVCGLATDDDSRVRIAAFGVVNKENITEALALMGPLTVAIDATKSTFHFYSSGIYHDDTCVTDTYSHHLLIVGHSPVVYAATTAATNSATISINSTNSAMPMQAPPPAIANVVTSPEYYIMKNSFGTDWGENGYARFLIDESRNRCLPQGVATYPNLMPIA